MTNGYIINIPTPPPKTVSLRLTPSHFPPSHLYSPTPLPSDTTLSDHAHPPHPHPLHPPGRPGHISTRRRHPRPPHHRLRRAPPRQRRGSADALGQGPRPRLPPLR